jgi:serine protease Do
MFVANSKKALFLLLSTLTFNLAYAQLSASPVDQISRSSTSVTRYLPDFSSLITQAGTVVVNISATKRLGGSSTSTAIPEPSSGESVYEFLKHFQRNGQQDYELISRALGSGFIIEQSGYILTNAHIVENAENITVSLADGREFDAILVGIDKASDIALLKIPAANLPVARIGKPDQIQLGEWVFAIGAPFGFANSVTQGIISAKARELPRQNVLPLIQTDVPINPGNSGGPLFNLKGEVIGINTEIYSLSGGAMGISFAVPIDAAMQVEDKLRSHGLVRRSRLGVSMQTANWDIGEPLGLEKAGGAIISSVEIGGPAEKGRLRTGDVILAFDDREVTTSARLVRFVSDSVPGYKARLKVWRDQTIFDAIVSLGELEAYSALKEIKPGDVSPAKSSLSLRELSTTERKRFYTEGAVLVEIVRGRAQLSGLESGDIILAVNNRPVLSIEQLRKELVKSGDRIALLIQRDANTKFFIALLKPDVDDASALIKKIAE